MVHNLIKPDYNNSIVNVSNSILKHFTGQTYHTTLPAVDEALAEHAYQHVMLLIFDGMGVDTLEHHLEKDSLIRRHLAQEITSVYPSTTGAALTAIYSGKTPLETGWLGWQCFFKEYGHNVVLFNNQDYYTKIDLTTPRPRENLLKYESIMDRIGKFVKTAWIMPNVSEPGDVIISHNLDEFFANLALAAKRDCQFIVGYWDEPDSTMHRTGVYSQEAKQIISNMNDRLENMCDTLKDTLVILIADHGQLDVECCSLNDYPQLTKCFAQPPALDPRCVAFFLKPECKEEFATNFCKIFANDFELMSGEEFLASGLLGQGTPHPKAKDFVGDFVAVATGNKILQYQTQDGVMPFAFKGQHAGLRAEEMRVPLVLIKNK